MGERGGEGKGEREKGRGEERGGEGEEEKEGGEKGRIRKKEEG